MSAAVKVFSGQMHDGCWFAGCIDGILMKSHTNENPRLRGAHFYHNLRAIKALVWPTLL